MEKMKTRSAKRITGKAVLAKAVKALSPKSAGGKPSKKKLTPEDLTRRIEVKAYELYVSRGYSTGDDLGDWLEAERIVKAELGL